MYKYLIVLVLLSSCATPKKLKKLMDKLPEETAVQCAERFPIKETIDTLYTVDSNVLNAYQEEYNRLNIKIDSLLYAGCDTIFIDSIKEVIKTLPAKTNTKIILKTQESTAKLQAAKDSCDKITKSFVTTIQNNVTMIDKLTAANNKLNKQNNWLWVVIVASTAWMFRKRVVSLVKHLV
jgi:hypothetical protein